jgi:hypothetical protein
MDESDDIDPEISTTQQMSLGGRYDAHSGTITRTRTEALPSEVLGKTCKHGSGTDADPSRAEAVKVATEDRMGAFPPEGRSEGEHKEAGTESSSTHPELCILMTF